MVDSMTLEMQNVAAGPWLRYGWREGLTFGPGAGFSGNSQPLQRSRHWTLDTGQRHVWHRRSSAEFWPLLAPIVHCFHA